MNDVLTDLDRNGISFILADQNGWFETRSAFNAPTYKANANEVVDALGGINFFAPIAPPRSISGRETVACPSPRRSVIRIAATLSVRSRPNRVTFSAKSRCPSTSGRPLTATGRSLSELSSQRVTHSRQGTFANTGPRDGLRAWLVPSRATATDLL